MTPMYQRSSNDLTAKATQIQNRFSNLQDNLSQKSENAQQSMFKESDNDTTYLSVIAEGD